MAASRSVVYRIRADVTQAKAQISSFSASLKKAADDATNADKESAKFRRGLDGIGDSAGKVGLAAVAGLGLVTKAAMDWESAWAGVTKTVNGTTSEMAELEDGLRELTKVLPASHAEIAGVAEAAGQLGVAREDILEFTKTMIDLGETTNLTAEEAATSIAQISNVMGTVGADVDNFGATLVALGNDGASTEKQILDMAQRIAGTGAQIGLAETDILAIANAAASMGIDAEAGGSAISRVFTELAKAVATGSPKLLTFAQTAGLTADEFSRAFGEDPAAAFAQFTSGLDGVNKSGGDVFTLLKSLGMSDVRVSQALLSMAASGDLLTDSLNLGKQAWKENTALTKEAEKRYATTAAQVEMSWNEIKDAGIDAGAALLPIVSGVADVVGDMAGAFASLPGPVKSATTGMAGVVAILGGGLWFTAKTISGITGMRGHLSDLGITGGGVKGKLRGLASFIGGPWSLAFAGATILLGDYMAQQAKTKGYVDSLTAALDDQTGAMTRSAIATNLNDEGWLEYAQSIGVGADTVIDAALGSAEAMDVLKAAADKESGFFNIKDGLTGDSGQFIENVEAQAAAQKQAQKEAKLLAEANGDTADAADDASTATNTATIATSGLREVTVKTTEELKAEADAIAKAKDEAWDTVSAFYSLSDGIEDVAATSDTAAKKATLSGWIKEMADAADAAKNFRENLKASRENGVDKGLLAQLADMGPEGEKQLKWLAGATKEQVEAANREWRKLQRELQRTADAIDGIPAPKPIVIKVLKKTAMEDLYRLRDFTIGDKTIKVHTVRVGNGGDAGVDYLSGRGYADGGYTGAGGKYEPAGVVHRGEYVFDAQATKGNEAFLASLHGQLRGYATGGMVGAGSMPTSVSLGAGDVARLASAMSNARPLYGDVSISGDPTVFKQQMQRDARMAQRGGRP